MGASGKWVKTLIGFKKPAEKDELNEKLGGGKGKKWKLWKNPSGELSNWKKSFKTRRYSESETASPRNGAFNDAVATVIRAPPKDFRAVRQEWAAIRIQTAFRGFLARRALKALKGIVRIQALVRGRQVRKQAAVTLRCMQALVRVQARVRARRVRMSIEGQAVQKLLDERRSEADLLKDAEEGWCDSKRTLQEVKSKLQMRQDGAFKRERALAYALAQKQIRSLPGSEALAHISLKNFEVAKNSWGWTWLERWMAAKPWENRLMEEVQSTTSDLALNTKSIVSSVKNKCPRSSELTPPSSVKVRKNNMTTRITAKPPPHTGQSAATRSSSSPSSEFLCGESSGSPSVCTSMTPVSGAEESGGKSSVPNYMNLTESTKAKRRGGSYLAQRMARQSMDEVQFSKLGGFSNLKTSRGYEIAHEDNTKREVSVPHKRHLQRKVTLHESCNTAKNNEPNLVRPLLMRITLWRINYLLSELGKDFIFWEDGILLIPQPPD
ncbi:hypothetical protein V2J09_010040 [Rumex salicifolius]